MEMESLMYRYNFWQDYQLGEGTVRVIWAYQSENDVQYPYHGQNRGVKSVALTGLSENLLRNSVQEDSDVIAWDIVSNNIKVPSDTDTMYWCQVYKAPELKEKHHMIGVDIIIVPTWTHL